jgi:small subunit ribosomal protein S16
MLKIRMQRTGRINSPSYRIVVVEHTASPKAGKFVEKLGTYDPRSKQRTINEERVKYWMSVGAKPSDTMHNMLVSLGILSGKKINVLPKFVEPAKEEAPAEAAAPAVEAAAEAAPEATEEAPAEETPAEEAKA